MVETFAPRVTLNRWVENRGDDLFGDQLALLAEPGVERRDRDFRPGLAGRGFQVLFEERRIADPLVGQFFLKAQAGAGRPRFDDGGVEMGRFSFFFFS